MIEINQLFITTAIIAFVVAIGLQFILTLVVLTSLRSASKERAHFNKEVYGLVRKIEGLTATKRELLIKQYDKLFDSLSVRLPSTIASHASQAILETESKILHRLTEIEPSLKNDAVRRQKLDELVKLMENMEQMIVVLTAETVRKVMAEGRSDFFMEQRDGEISLAA